MDIRELLPVVPVDEEKKHSYRQGKSFFVKNFYSVKLLGVLEKILPNVEYYQHDYSIGPQSRVLEMVANPRFMRTIRELMNDSSVISSIEQITGLKGLYNFNGRHYKLDSSVGGIEWHHDMDNNKKLGLTINIGPELFHGGELIIRRKSTGETQKFHNTGLGDAVFFEIHEDYEHCVLPVTGNVPKLAVTGWYHVP